MSVSIISLYLVKITRKSFYLVILEKWKVVLQTISGVGSTFNTHLASSRKSPLSHVCNYDRHPLTRSWVILRADRRTHTDRQTDRHTGEDNIALALSGDAHLFQHVCYKCRQDTRKAESLTFVWRSMVHEWSTRTCARARWSSWAARCRALSPLYAWLLTGTLPAGPNSNASISTWPSCAAKCTGVYPLCNIENKKIGHTQLLTVKQCIIDLCSTHLP